MNASFTNRSIIDDSLAYMLQDAYGYVITPPSRFGTFYDRLDANGKLTIRTPTGGTDQVTLQVVGSNLQVSMGIGAPVLGIDPAAITSIFPLSSITSIDIDTGDQADVVTLSPISSSIPIKLVMGDTADELRINGSAGNDIFSVSLPTITSTGLNLTTVSGVNILTFYTNNGNSDIYMPHTGSITQASIVGYTAGEIIGLYTLDFGTPTTISGNGGNDIINIADGSFAGTIRSKVVVHGNDDNDTINLAQNLPFGLAAILDQISVFGDAGNDTLNIGSGNVDAIDATVTFDGGSDNGGVFGDRIIFNDQNIVYTSTYDVGAGSIARTGQLSHNFTYSATENIIIQGGLSRDTVTVHNGVSAIVSAFGNDGADIFVRGDGNLASSSAAFFNGGNGDDTLTFDDHLSTDNTLWDIRSNVVYRSLITQDTTGFETVSILAGTGDNEITFDGSLNQSFNIDAGGGNDTVILTAASNYQDFTGQSGPPEFHYAMDIDGGSGFNTLSVDDRTDFDRSYAIWPDRILIDEGAPLGLDFNYDSFQSMTIQAPTNPLQFTPQFHIFGTSADIPVSQQMTILGSAIADQFVLHPHDAAGNLTINGNLGIGGGSGGFDTLVIDDTGSSLPIGYSFYNQFGPSTTNIGGLGAANFGAGSNIESITVSAGNGHDQFDINAFQSGSALAINGGGGNDTLNFGVSNLTSDITNMASFHFNGQGDFDVFNLNNTANPTAFTYTRGIGTVAASNAFGANYVMTDSNVESMQFNAGPQGDTFLVDAVAAGSSVAIFGGAGLDGLGMGFTTSNLDAIQGPIFYYAGPDGGNLHALDSADTTGDTVHLDFIPDNGMHIEESSLGAHPGDNLFGPGGALYFTDVVNFGAFAAITLTLGSGADTIYAQPFSTGRVTINANNPTSGAGDKLNLALAQAQNYVITGTTSGNVTSSNLQTLDWNGIEQAIVVDDVAPQIISQNYEETPQSTIRVQFSEDLPQPLDAAYLYLSNDSIFDVIPTSVMSVAYNAGTDIALFTFPGYPNGKLPPGDYTAAIVGTLTDLFGNPLGNETFFAFTVQPPLIGDYDGDGVVGQADYGVWKANFGSSVIPGTMGDGNGDGVVNAADYTVWRNNLGAASPGSGGGSSLSSDTFSPDPLNRNEVNLEVSDVTDVSSAVRLTGFDAVRSRVANLRTGNLHPPDSSVFAARRDGGLLAWLASQAQHQREQYDRLAATAVIRDRADTVLDSRCDVADRAFATLLVGIEPSWSS